MPSTASRLLGRMTKLEEQFGALVRHFRKRAGLSQAQLAERIGRQPNAVQRLESGAATPTFDTVVRLAQALDIDVRDLFGVEGYAAGSGREDPMARIFRQLVGLNDGDLEKLDELIAVALRMRN